MNPRLEELKKLFILQRKPFPLWALLALYEKAPRQLYINHFADFKLLRGWLAPIELPPLAEQDSKIPALHHTYEIQELAKHLNCTQGQIYRGHKTTLAKLQFSIDSA